MKSNKISHQQPPNPNQSYHNYGLKANSHNKHNNMSRRSTYGRFSLAPKCVTTVVTKTSTEPPLLLSNTHLPSKLDPSEYPLANLQTSLKRFCYDNNGVPTYKKINDTSLMNEANDEKTLLKKKNRHDTSASSSTNIKNLPSPTLSPTPINESRQFLSSPVENSNHSINIPNNEIDGDEVMATRDASVSSHDDHHHKNRQNNVINSQEKSPSHINKPNSHKQKGGLGDDEVLELDDNENIEINGSYSRKTVYNKNNFRGFTEEDTDEEESLFEEEEEDDELVGEGKMFDRQYYSSMEKYKSLDSKLSSSYPSTYLNPIITTNNNNNNNQNPDALKSSHDYYNQCTCGKCETCSDQEMYDDYSQYGKRSHNQGNQDPLSPYSGSSPPTALSDVPNIVTMYDELNSNTQSLVLLRLLKRCPVSTLQFVSSLILPVLKYDIISLLPVELTYKILNYLDIEDIYHCMMVCHSWKKIIDSPGAELAIWKQKLIEKQWYDEEKIRAILTEYKQRKLKAKAKKASQLLLLKHPNSEFLMDALSASSSNSSTSYSSSSSFTVSPNQNITAMNNPTIPINNSLGDGQNNNLSYPSSQSFNNLNYKLANDMQVINSSEYEFIKNCPQNFYKRLYRRNYLLNHNWQHGRCHQISFSGHEQNVVTCLQFDSDRIISGSDDQTINVYDTKTGQLLKKLEGHNGGVWALQYWKNTLVSGSTDRTVRVWDIEEGRCTHKFHGHTSTVRCLIIVTPTENPITHNVEPEFPVIITGSRDSNLRIWKLPDIKKDPPYNSSDYGNGSNSNNPYFLKLLNGHTDSVRAIAGSGNVLVSGSYDHTVRIWNISSGDNTFILRGHREKVYSIGYSPELQKAASGSMDFNVRVWSTTSGECLFNLEGHSSLVGLLEISPNYIISGAADSTLRIWSAETGQCMSVLNGHQAAISCFHHDPKLNRIVSGSDGGVKLWELCSTGPSKSNKLLSDTRTGISKNVTYGKYVRELIRGVQGVWRVRMDERRLVCAVQREGGRTWFEVLDFGSGLDILNDKDFEDIEEDTEEILSKAKEFSDTLQIKNKNSIDNMNMDDDACSCSNLNENSLNNAGLTNSRNEDEINILKNQPQQQSTLSFESLMAVDSNDTIPTNNFSN
ncbi:hypothetical protein BCR36DRAFT_348454 [Piromyces finnis]|uniref:F-box domain-containing protein n=1 Tax=Piromyces finnis TaxID=1754191 RepID=A0A1Y1VFT3_9FUNG|nr:hypothetical protein BCR36DRAFT_348454 [Piromyces finnis]|eukprot:ORX54302.1 hypothetical protein BCR36DRAFT_348454 [Piromyces finnis]